MQKLTSMVIRPIFYLSDYFPFNKAIEVVDKVLDGSVIAKEEADPLTSVINTFDSMPCYSLISPASLKATFATITAIISLIMAAATVKKTITPIISSMATRGINVLVTGPLV